MIDNLLTIAALPLLLTAPPYDSGRNESSLQIRRDMLGLVVPHDDTSSPKEDLTLVIALNRTGGHGLRFVHAGYRGTVHTPWFAISDPEALVDVAKNKLTLRGKLTPPTSSLFRPVTSKRIMLRPLIRGKVAKHAWLRWLFTQSNLPVRADNPWLHGLYLYFDYGLQLDSPRGTLDLRVHVLGGQEVARGLIDIGIGEWSLAAQLGADFNAASRWLIFHARPATNLGPRDAPRSVDSRSGA